MSQEKPNTEQSDDHHLNQALAELQRACDEERETWFPNAVPEWTPEDRS